MENEKVKVFVFGSNTQGRHGAGAARDAKERWGAIYGQAEGRQGNAYGIVTKELRSDKPKVTLQDVKAGVGRFIEYAKANPEIQFLLTPVGCGLAGFTDDQIAPLFSGAPSNVLQPHWVFASAGQRGEAAPILLAIIVCLTVIGGGCWIYPQYRVYEQQKEGEANLREAESSRQIKTLEAKAAFESATHLANAEVARAKGVAEANKIIGESLKGNEAYLRYLWITSLDDAKGGVIYIPTEAGMPILEAGRLSKPVEK